MGQDPFYYTFEECLILVATAFSGHEFPPLRGL